MSEVNIVCDQEQLKIIELRGVSELDNNVHIVISPSSGEAIIVDACAEAELILETCRPYRPQMIATTHGHSDHTGAVEAVREALNIPFLIHPSDHFLLEKAGGGKMKPAPDDAIVPGQELVAGEVALHPVFTPGHTPGSVCFVTEPYLFSGDTLFPGGPGATHWDYSDFGQIMDSIEQELFSMSDPTLVYPGHGDSTTIGAERPAFASWKARGW